jgi:hypothetical protein
MACKYVKEFDFGPQKTYVQGYARGGSVKAMAKREMESTPTMEKRESVQRTQVRAPAAPREMLRDKSALGIRGNKNPGERRGMPVAPREPMIPLKRGGCVGGMYAKGGAAKVGKVMGEFKAGELHSGSKSGPVVKNPKQAVAIALSEARQAARKK